MRKLLPVEKRALRGLFLDRARGLWAGKSTLSHAMSILDWAMQRYEASIDAGLPVCTRCGSFAQWGEYDRGVMAGESGPANRIGGWNDRSSGYVCNVCLGKGFRR